MRPPCLGLTARPQALARALVVAAGVALAALVGGRASAQPLPQVQPGSAAQVARVGGSSDRDALVREIHLRLLALREQPGDPARRALEISRCELYLAALEALAREEQIRAAALRHGARAQGQLQQAAAAAHQMTSSLERAIAP